MGGSAIGLSCWRAMPQELANPVTGAGIASAVQSGKMAGEAAAEFIGREPRAAEAYADELEEIFGVSLNRALARRRELLASYSQTSQPGLEDMRRGWIAFPEYWSPLVTTLPGSNERPHA